jgi:cell division protein FtsW
VDLVVRTRVAPARTDHAVRAPVSRQSVPHWLDRPLSSYYLLLGAALMLTLLGLAMVLSASQIKALTESGSVFELVQKQALWTAIGLPLLWLASRLPVRSCRLLAYPLMFVSVLMMLLVLVPGLGVRVNGNQNWLHLGSLRLQPSEFAKLALVLWGADLLTRKQKLLGQWKHLLMPLLPGTALVIGLIMIGGDMGTSLVVGVVLFALLWTVGAPARLFVAMLGFAGGLITLGIMIRPSRVSRVGSFLDPFSDPEGRGWQAVHSIYALSSGGWLGTGLGAGRQKWGYLPEAHTDFIFAVIGEELGLIGTLSVLMLFAVVGYTGIRIASRTKDPFVRLTAAGVTAWLMAQVMINVGAVLGLLPIAGVPLPFVSYGGSALVPTMIGTGMLLSFAKREPGGRAVSAARGPGTVRLRARTSS